MCEYATTCACVHVCMHVCVCVCTHVAVGEEQRLALSAASPSRPPREEGGGPFLLMIPGSCGISQRTHWPRTKQTPQRFFPVSDSRKLPALSSACHIHSLLMSQPFFISWHFSSHPFSFVPLSVQAALLLFAFAGSAVPASVCPSRRLGQVLSLSLFSFLLLARAEQSGCQGHLSLELNPREKQRWNPCVILAPHLIFLHLVLNLPCSPGTSGGQPGCVLGSGALGSQLQHREPPPLLLTWSDPVILSYKLGSLPACGLW